MNDEQAFLNSPFPQPKILEKKTLRYVLFLIPTKSDYDKKRILNLKCSSLSPNVFLNDIFLGLFKSLETVLKTTPHTLRLCLLGVSCPASPTSLPQCIPGRESGSPVFL